MLARGNSSIQIRGSCVFSIVLRENEEKLECSEPKSNLPITTLRSDGPPLSYRSLVEYVFSLCRLGKTRKKLSVVVVFLAVSRFIFESNRLLNKKQKKRFVF